MIGTTNQGVNHLEPPFRKLHDSDALLTRTLANIAGPELNMMLFRSATTTTTDATYSLTSYQHYQCTATHDLDLNHRRLLAISESAFLSL